VVRDQTLGLKVGGEADSRDQHVTITCAADAAVSTHEEQQARRPGALGKLAARNLNELGFTPVQNLPANDAQQHIRHPSLGMEPESAP